MAKLDPEHERQRLAELYSGLPDDYLLKIAQDSLTQVARAAMDDELRRRRLAVPVPAEKPTITSRTLMVVANFRDVHRALLAKGAVESAGIECFLRDDNFVRMNWLVSDAVGGIRLQVAPEDAEAARQVLNQPIPETLEVEGVGEYQQPTCPECQSLDVSLEGTDPSAYVTAAIGVPIPFYRPGWKCASCGHEWRESETDADEQA